MNLLLEMNNSQLITNKIQLKAQFQVKNKAWFPMNKKIQLKMKIKVILRKMKMKMKERMIITHFGQLMMRKNLNNGFPNYSQ